MASASLNRSISVAIDGVKRDSGISLTRLDTAVYSGNLSACGGF